jgi:hypothetical protein
MIPTNVNSKEELLKYLIPLGFYLRRDDDDDFYLYKDGDYGIGLRFNSLTYDVRLYYLTHDNKGELVTEDFYDYPVCIEYLNKKFKGDFRRNKLKRII